MTTTTTNDRFPCRDCGHMVLWATSRKTGKRYLASPLHWYGTEHGAERTYLPSHTCMPNPEWQALVAEQRAAADAAAAKKAELAAAGMQAPEGRTTLTGTITKITNKGDDYAPIWKMTVLSDEGWSVWVSIPAAFTRYDSPLSSALDRSFDRPTLEVGERIEVTATLTRSDRDPLFAFGKRPIVKQTA